MKEAKVELSEIQTLRNHLGGGKDKRLSSFHADFLPPQPSAQPDSLTPAAAPVCEPICAFKKLLLSLNWNLDPARVTRRHYQPHCKNQEFQQHNPECHYLEYLWL